MIDPIDKANRPEYLELLARSNNLLEAIKTLKENSDEVDWRELKRLTDELSANSDKMTAMIL